MTIILPKKKMRLMSLEFGKPSSTGLGGRPMTLPWRFSTPKATAGGPSMRILMTRICVAVNGSSQPKIKVEITINATAATLVDT